MRRLISLAFALIFGVTFAAAQDEASDRVARKIHAYYVPANVWDSTYNQRGHFAEYIRSLASSNTPTVMPSRDVLNSELKQMLVPYVRLMSEGRMYSFRTEADRRSFMRKVVDEHGYVRDDVYEILAGMRGEVYGGGGPYDYYHRGRPTIGNEENGAGSGLIEGTLANDSVSIARSNHERDFYVPDNGYLLYLPTPVDGYGQKQACVLTQQVGTEIKTGLSQTMYVRNRNNSMRPTVVIHEFTGTGGTVPDMASSGTQIFKYTHRIKADDARLDTRAAVQPLVYEVSEEDETRPLLFMRLKPRVLDGEDFNANQSKRKGYAMEKNDPLAKYLDTTRVMHGNGPDSIVFNETFGTTRDGYHYPVYIRYQYRNHLGIYTDSTRMVKDGRELSPMYFITPVTGNDEIVRERYEKIGVEKKTEQKSNYQLFFETGKNKLEPGTERGDMGFRAIGQCAEALQKLRAAGNSLEGIVITGYASPEGDEGSNKTLARQRAEFFRQQLLGYNSAYQISIAEPVVVPWEAVADTLRDMGTAMRNAARKQNNDELLQQGNQYIDYSEQVREICNRVSGMRNQEALIKKLDFYSTVLDRRDTFCVLDRMRIDAVNVDYTVMRVKSEEEILHDFDTNPRLYTHDGAVDYEYYVLFEHFKNNPDTLRALAQRAYETISDGFQPRKERPWSLAAYYLAKSKMALGECDTTIIDSRYLDTRRVGPQHCFDPSVTNIDEVDLNPYNDPALVLLQMQMMYRLRRTQRMWDLLYQCYGKDRNPSLELYVECCRFPAKCFDPDNVVRFRGMSTWNEAVINTMQHPAYNPDAVNCWSLAYNLMMEDRETFPLTDARVNYMLAMLRYRMHAPRNLQDADVDPRQLVNYFKAPVMDESLETDEDMDDYEERMAVGSEDELDTTWGAPMVKAVTLQPELLKHLRWDGYFPIGYYKALVMHLKKSGQWPLEGAAN